MLADFENGNTHSNLRMSSLNIGEIMKELPRKEMGNLRIFKNSGSGKYQVNSNSPCGATCLESRATEDSQSVPLPLDCEVPQSIQHDRSGRKLSRDNPQNGQ